MDTVTKSRRKPPEKRGSRKGIPNKVTADIKAMVTGALADAGGRQYLAERAMDPKTAPAFLALADAIGVDDRRWALAARIDHDGQRMGWVRVNVRTEGRCSAPMS